MTPTSLRVVALCAVLTCFSANALEQVAYRTNATIPARQWEVLDIAFNASDVPAQPEDVAFNAVLRHGQEQFTAHGFHNGGDEFLLRFTPPSEGTWTLTTRSSLPSLNELSGVVSALPANESRKGGIRIHPQSKRRFQYANGDDYFPIAFEADWLFALDADNAKDIPVTRRFVDQLARNGFNQIVMNVFAYDVTWAKDSKLPASYEYGSPRAFPFRGSNERPDHSRLNHGYFQRLDRVIDYLDQKGIAAHLMIYVWNKRVNWPEPRSAADNRYFDHVVKRYQAFPNLVWDVSKEALAYGRDDITYVHDRIERLRGLDAYNRLVTVHAYSYCRRFPEKIDFISAQLWGSELYSTMRNVWRDIPGKPILNIEHGGYERGPYVVFEGNYTSPEACLERAWQCVFAGTYPTHYWQGAAWNVIIPDFESLAVDERPRFDYYRHMNAFAREYRLARLRAGDKQSASGFCLHDGANLMIFYVPKENSHIDVRAQGHQGKRMTGKWFNPFTGEIEKTFTEKLPQWPRYAKPAGEGFRILVVSIAD